MRYGLEAVVSFLPESVISLLARLFPGLCREGDSFGWNFWTGASYRAWCRKNEELEQMGYKRRGPRGPRDGRRRGGFVAENAQAGVKQYTLLVGPGKTVKQTVDELVDSARRKMGEAAEVAPASQSPFRRPDLMGGYPLSADEKASVERVIRDSGQCDDDRRNP